MSGYEEAEPATGHGGRDTGQEGTVKRRPQLAYGPPGVGAECQQEQRQKGLYERGREPSSHRARTERAPARMNGDWSHVV